MKTKETSKKLFARVIALLLAGFCIFLSFGCIPTPESEFIVSNDEQSFLAKAKEQNDLSNAKDPYEALGAPHTFRGTWTSAGGRLSAEANASVVIETAALPVARCRHIPLTDADIERYSRVLFGEDAIYLDPDAPLPQISYLPEITRLEDGIANWEDWGHVRYDNFDTVEQAERFLEQKYREMSLAPKEWSVTEPDYTLKAKPVITQRGEEDLGMTSATLWARAGESGHSELYVTNQPAFGTYSAVFVRDKDRNIWGITHERDPRGTEMLSLTESDAIERAERALANMGLEDFTLACAYPVVRSEGNYDNAFWNVEQWGFWQLHFTRSVSDAPITYTDAGYIFATEELYNIPWYQEWITVMMDDEGIFCFDYEGKTEVTGFETECANLLPFEEISSIFSDWITLYHNREALAPASWMYHITSVRLGLMSVREKDGDGGLLIPVWDFLGYQETHEADGTIILCYTDEQIPFLTINAVDGSIIDRGNTL